GHPGLARGLVAPAKNPAVLLPEHAGELGACAHVPKRVQEWGAGACALGVATPASHLADITNPADVPIVTRDVLEYVFARPLVPNAPALDPPVRFTNPADVGPEGTHRNGSVSGPARAVDEVGEPAPAGHRPVLLADSASVVACGGE